MDEEEILAALREHVARVKGANTGDAGASPGNGLPQNEPPVYPMSDLPQTGMPSDQSPATKDPIVDRGEISHVSAEVAALQTAVGQLNPRNAGLLNSIAQRFKKIIQRSLTWYTRPLQAFHRGVADGFETHGRAINSIQDQVISLRNELPVLHSRMSSHREQLSSIGARLASIQQQLQKFKDDLPSRIEFQLQTLNGRMPEAIAVAELARQEQQSPYVPLFQGASPVLDIGCGRGEFLELLKEAGIRAYGVDSDPVACDAAHAKALQVVQGDLFEHLRRLPNRYLGGIFSARVIEYLPAHLLPELVALCAQKLKARGVVVIETANPDADSAFGRTYRIDPSHLRPIYPEVLKAMLDSKGFVESRVCFLAPQEASSAVAEPGVREQKADAERLPPHSTEGSWRPRAYAVIARLP